MRVDSGLLLSATELWERFTYYAMRALLVLYLVAPPTAGGFGLADREATSIYGLFVAAVYLAALPGGWVADRYLGPVRAIWLGGLAITAGNGVLALAHTLATFGVGLAMIAVGVGLLKPNVTALVGRAAQASGQAIDGAFTLFYVGINVGGLLGPLVSAGLAARYGWHWGFAASAVGMLVGLLAFGRVAHRFSDVDAPREAPSKRALALALAVVAIAIVGCATIPVARLVQIAFAIVVVATALGFGSLFSTAAEPRERRNVTAMLGLFCGATLFWAAGEQAGASLTLFAERFTDRTVAGHAFPAAWYQALYPFYVVLLAPWFVVLWRFLAARGREPDAMVKFAGGLALGAVSLGVVACGAWNAGAHSAAPSWLVVGYLLLALGEILMAPVGLSAATRLAPAGRTGFAAGLWYLSLSLGGLLAGLTGGLFDFGTSSGLATAFVSVGGVLAAASAMFMLVARRQR